MMTSCNYCFKTRVKVFTSGFVGFFLGNRHVVEVQPFGIPPIPRRRCGYCIVNNEVIFCGGTR